MKKQVLDIGNSLNYCAKPSGMKVLDILLGCHIMVRVRYCEAQENEAIRRANDGKQYRDGAFTLF